MNKSRLIGALCVVVSSASFFANVANASLVQADYITSGDNLSVYDSAQNLNWLDLSVSTGWSTTTWSTLVEQNAGWRLATNSEVESLLFSGFPNVTDPHLINSATYLESETAILGDIDSFHTLFGGTPATSSYGFYQDEDSIWRMAGVDNALGNRTIFGGEFSNDYNTLVTSGSSSFGFYLVQTAPVPVPAAVWLFGSGLIGLVGIARKRKIN